MRKWLPYPTRSNLWNLWKGTKGSAKIARVFHYMWLDVYGYAKYHFYEYNENILFYLTSQYLLLKKYRISYV